jgi:hypothetical protein
MILRGGVDTDVDVDADVDAAFWVPRRGSRTAAAAFDGAGLHRRGPSGSRRR